ncbi:MAG: response regulator [Oscillospiraceae bacterium]|nr:response regulator [Oscillospiraceae bacterium]MBQ4166082.1 response regulator [Oscillospiraceae bacterium]
MKISELKVLVCDDSILIRKKMNDLLKKAGVAEVIEANDGMQSVEMYKEHKPDIVFMDIVMPLKTGLDALKEIKAFDADAKVVMVSTIGTQAHLVDAIKAGAFEFLQKPIKAEDIVKVFDKIKG